MIARHPQHGGDVVASGAADHACGTTGARRSLFGARAIPTALGLPLGHAIAAYVPDEAGETVVVMSTSADGRTTRVLTRQPVSPSIPLANRTPPGLGRIGDGRVAFATVDGIRRIDYRELDLATGEVSPPIRIAEGGNADTRFPPAIASVGELRLVAYTKLGNPQRVEVVVLDAIRVLRRHDVTPDSAGAASPTFVRSVDPPLLIFVDPREAFSLSHAVVFDAQGRPGSDDALQPILGLAAPARIAAGLGPHDLHLVFLAHGGTNQMGSFTLGAHASVLTPQSLVPPSDFARLWVDALGTPFGAVTTSLAPHDETMTVRDVAVRLIDAAGVGPELRLQAARGSAFYPTPTRDDAGHLAVVFGTDVGIDLAPIACRGLP